VARPAEGAEEVLERPPANWEPLVTDAVWAEVQTRLVTVGMSYQRQASRTYLLSGFLRCPVCQLRLSGSSNVRRDRPKETSRLRYRCSGYARGANAPVAQCVLSVPMLQADAAVIEQVAALLDTLGDPSRRPGLQRALQALEEPQGDPARIDTVKREIDKAVKAMGRLTIMYANKEIQSDEYNAGTAVARQTIEDGHAEIDRAVAA
jgi:hypothetical protein